MIPKTDGGPSGPPFYIVDALVGADALIGPEAPAADC